VTTQHNVLTSDNYLEAQLSPTARVRSAFKERVLVHNRQKYMPNCHVADVHIVLLTLLTVSMHNNVVAYIY